MPDNMIEKLWLIGSGPMAIDYSKVLDELSVDYDVIGRGDISAKAFKKSTGHSVITGGLTKRLTNVIHDKPDAAIVAVGIEKLAETTIELLNHGFKNILVEKPSGMNAVEIQNVAECTKENNANVFVAYNRRFYASVLKAKEIIGQDGGVTSFNFEFTEWAHEIEKLEKAPGVKENWFLGNSSHVVDLAFYLGGKPTEISSYASGALAWHPAASVFSGAGRSDSGALFSYRANWESAGRWGVEILTANHKLIFKPIEKLQIQNRGSISVEEVTDIDYTFDEKFKPGLYKQVEAFYLMKSNALCSLSSQSDMSKIYESISLEN
jgi:predicted dehydrogenase